MSFRPCEIERSYNFDPMEYVVLNGGHKGSSQVMDEKYSRMLRKYILGKRASTCSENLREPTPFTTRVLVLSISFFPDVHVQVENNKKSAHRTGWVTGGMQKTRRNVRCGPPTARVDNQAIQLLVDS